MKELSIEDKAKAYDKALEALRSLIAEQAIKHCDRVNIKDITNIFSELKESEDERMLNQLHSWMKEFGGAEEYTEKVYQWIKGLLEKQGELSSWKPSKDEMDALYGLAYITNKIDFEQELYNYFGQVKDFTLGMRIAKRFYDMGKNSQEPVSDDLSEYINELSKQFPEVSFAKLSRIAVRVAKWQKEKEYTCYEEVFEDVAKWKKEQMMAKAIDGEILEVEDNDCAICSHTHLELYIEPDTLEKNGFKDNDKVKVIVIKEDCLKSKVS